MPRSTLFDAMEGVDAVEPDELLGNGVEGDPTPSQANSDFVA